MDLILLQPGNPAIFGGENSWKNGGSLIDNKDDLWKDFKPPSKNIGQCFELVSIHQGMKQQVTTDVSNSARTSGRPIITEFTCVKYVDKTSVKLFEYCLRAEPLGKDASAPSIIYILRNSGDRTANLLTIQLRDAIVSEIQFQSNPDDMPTEQFKLNFTEILWSYTIQKANTETAGSIHAGWSLAHNRTIGQFT
ncbi:MAG: type VI secretion system tube protein Hcp [Betaproteobacteria bacterium]|nr:type VI secretion system tube protein Hcp [Betaproteobacteria bacterium]